jgi:hypothetical protein
MPNTKVVITHAERVLVFEHSEMWTAADGMDQPGAVRVQLFGRDGMVEIILAPSDMAAIVTLAETATAHAAAEKLRRSAPPSTGWISQRVTNEQGHFVPLPSSNRGGSGG